VSLPRQQPCPARSLHPGAATEGAGGTAGAALPDFDGHKGQAAPATGCEETCRQHQVCHFCSPHNQACLSSIYRAPARGRSTLGNCPNLAKILFVQRVARHVRFGSNSLGCPWPGPGSWGTPLPWLAGRDGDERAGEQASGRLPGERAASSRSIPTPRGPRAGPHLPTM